MGVRTCSLGDTQLNWHHLTSVELWIALSGVGLRVASKRKKNCLWESLALEVALVKLWAVFARVINTLIRTISFFPIYCYTSRGNRMLVEERIPLNDTKD